MVNRVISYSFRGFQVFLKVPGIIIMRFGENVLGIIYINFEGFAVGGYMVHLTLFVYYSQKTEILKEHEIYQNQILHHFGVNLFFLRRIIYKITKMGPTPIFLGSKYSSPN